MRQCTQTATPALSESDDWRTLTMQDKAILEIERLHSFIAGWFRGEFDRTDFEPGFAQALHPEFENIQPSGAVLSRADLLEPIRQAHGANPDFDIEIEEPRILATWPGLTLATYVEYQTGARNSRPTSSRTSRTAWRAWHALVTDCVTEPNAITRVTVITVWWGAVHTLSGGKIAGLHSVAEYTIITIFGCIGADATFFAYVYGT